MKNWLLFICLLATLQLATNQISSPVQLTHSFETRPLDAVPLPELEPRPVDCCDIKRNSHRQLKSGKYTIYPSTAENKAVEVYCDMDTKGGGWTVFLLRNTTRGLPKNRVNFNRDWTQYRDGFGNPDKEYWLGNENLHALTQSRQNVLRLEYSGRPVSSSVFEPIWGEWDTFSVASNAEKYKLTVMDPNPNNTASNETIDYHNGMLFTTYDENHNRSNRNCADLCKGGWWYSNCYKINPTGRHFYIDNTGIRVDPWSKEIPIPGYAHRLQLKMRIPVCGY